MLFYRAPIVKVLDLVQFFGWFALSSVYIDVVLNSIITKLQCFVFCMKIIMPPCAKTSILSLKLHT